MSLPPLLPLDQQAWLNLPKTDPMFYKERDKISVMIDLFDIVENETPFYQFEFGGRSGNYTEKEKTIIHQWFMSVIEGKDYSADVKGMFDCFIERLQIKRNLKLLQLYKQKIYSKLKTHRTLDNEVLKLNARSETNLERLEKL